MKEKNRSDAQFLSDAAKAFSLDENKVFYCIVENPLTLSSQKKFIVRACNMLIREYPDVRNTVFALLTYSTQKWASKARTELHLNEGSFSVMAEDSRLLQRQFHGILKQGISPKLSYDFKDKLERSEQIIIQIENAVQWLSEDAVCGEKLAGVIKAAHFTEDEAGYKDISKHYFEKYYEIAVLNIHSRFGSQIEDLVTEMNQASLLFGGSQYGSEYHNTAQLIKLFPYASRRLLGHGAPEDIWSDLRLQRDSNGLYLLMVYEQAAELLKKYPSDGEEMYQVITLLNENYKIKEIEKKLHITTPRIRALQTKATNLLSFVLWGYSTSQIINNMVLKKHSVDEFLKNLMK